MPTTETHITDKPPTSRSHSSATQHPATHSDTAHLADLDHDGIIDITSQRQVEALATHLLDPDRSKPVIVISVQVHDHWEIDADALYDQVTPLARLARVRSGWLTRELARSLPPHTEVYGSAGRVYPTGTSWLSDPSTSTLRIAAGPHEATAAAKDLATVALAAGYRPTRPVGCNCDRTKQLGAQIRELEQENRKLRSLTSPARPTAEPQRRPEPGLPPTTDPQTRFRAEVARQWISRIAQAEPDGTPLPEDYPLTPGFLASLDRLTLTEYRKTASVAMEILTGLVTTIPGRHVHPLRTGTGGNNPHRLTATGQIIWRANIQTNTPAARRIHWTRNTHGQIELLNTTSHDQLVAA